MKSFNKICYTVENEKSCEIIIKNKFNLFFNIGKLY